MSRLRTWIAAGTLAVAGGVAAFGGVSTATAATTPSWGTFALTANTARAYTGTMDLDGFPATTFTSTARQATVVSGASTWQGPSTPPGARYGTSRGESYLNLRPARDQPNAADASVTTYTFDKSTTMPVGAWSFVLGDIDADQATVSAVTTTGAQATPAQLGFQAAYNSCSTVSPGGWSCPRTTDDPNPGTDVPRWDAASTTLIGNAAASDTSGASGWFTPTVALRSLTITYQQRSGFPVYQTWFAVAKASLSGTATLDGAAYPGATVEVRRGGELVGTATTGADGSYTVPGLARSDDYVVTITAPSGATGAATRNASLAGGDATGADFAFTSPTGTASVVGTVVSSTDPGVPVAGVPVTLTNTTDPSDVTTVVSNGSGDYAVGGLDPQTSYDVTAPGAIAQTVTTGPAATTPAPAPDLSVPTSAVRGSATLDGSPYSGAPMTITDTAGNVIATTTTDVTGAYTFPAVAQETDYVVTITGPTGANGATSASATVVTSDVAVPRFTFTTPPPATVTGSGSVQDTTGAPVAGVPVTITPTGGGTPITATTAADGTYSAAGLVPGTAYTVTAPGAAPVTFTAGSDTTDINPLIVPATVTASGTVLGSTGSPAAGVAVGVVSATGTPVTATTGSDGTYTVAGLAPSTQYTATVTGADPVTFSTPASGTTTIPVITVRAVATTPPAGGTGSGVGAGSAVGSSAGTSVSSRAGALAYTGSDPAPALLGGGLLLALGAVFLVARAIRSRRHRDHLED
jgi:hypothetical protein